MDEQRSFVDYRQGGDSGNNEVDSIQPIADGEAATQTVFRRPSENIRGRTEVARDAFRELLYNRDFSLVKVSHPSGSSIAWGGSTTAAGTGIITQTGAVTIRPMLSPTASKKGSLSIGTGGVNQLTYTVTASGYATEGLDQVTVEHRDVLASALTCSISTGPVKRILVIFDSTNAAHTTVNVIAALNPLIAADTVLNTKLQVTNSGGGIISAATEDRIEGTVDQQAHVLSTGLLTTFTTTNPLEEGDCVAIWYRYLIDPITPGGGKWESNPDRATSNIPLASLFITNDNPEKIPGALPICKVIENRLVFVDGSTFTAGSTGSLGSISASDVTLNPSAFAGSDTTVVNGGIANVPNPTTVMDVLTDIDAKLGYRRAFTFVCTDGTTSTGGNYDSTSAIQDAITALGGSAGTLYVRRGTYTLPDTYVIPKDVSIIGEDYTLVILQQAVPTALTLQPNCNVENVTFTLGSVQMAVVGGARVANVTITGRVTVSTYARFYNVIVDGQAFSTDALTITGDNNSMNSVLVIGSTLISGNNNTLNNFLSGVATTTPAESVLRLTGSRNAITAYTCKTQSVNITAGKAFLHIAGDSNAVFGAEIETTGATITSGRYGVAVAGDNVVLDGVYCYMDEGSPLSLQGSSTSVTATSCTFRNSSATDAVVADGLLTGPHRLQFNNCVFDQNEQTGHIMWDVFNSSLASTSRDQALFNNCIFFPARLDNVAFRAVNSTFNSCQFTIKNPAVALARRLGGVADAQTSELFIFNSGCILRDCIINGNDSEVNNNAGNPAIQAPLYVRLSNARAYNLSLININKQVDVPATQYGLISLKSDAHLDGLSVAFTSTASVQGGSQNMFQAVNLDGDDVVFKNFYTDLTNWPGASSFRAVYQLTTASRFTADRITIEAQCAGFIAQAAAITLNDSNIDNVKIGVLNTSGAWLSAGVSFPVGDRNKFSNSVFHLEDTTNQALTFSGAATDCHYHNLMFHQMGTTASGSPVVGGIVTITRGIFTNCAWFATAAAGGTRAFSTATTFTDCAGAGNIHVFSGGAGTTPPSFSANVNIW